MATGVRFELIIPNKPIFDTRKFARNAKESLNGVISGADKDFKRTYPNPKYKKIPATITRMESIVMSTDKILFWNVVGTKPHLIFPKRGKMLRFQTGYRRKVKKRVIGRTQGGAFGPVVFARAVRHPGQEGTETDIAIAEKWQPRLISAINKDITNNIPS